MREKSRIFALKIELCLHIWVKNENIMKKLYTLFT